MKRKKIKIVFLVAGLGFGGSEKQFYLLMKNINKEIFDCNVVVFTPSQNYFSAQLEKMGINLISVPNSCENIWKKAFFIFSTLRKIKPEIIHSWNFYLNPYAGFLGRISGVKFRLGSFRTSFQPEVLNKLPFKIIKKSNKSLSKIVVNSETALYDMKSHSKILSSRVHFIPNCLEKATVKKREKRIELSQFNIEDKDIVIGMIGNLRWEKNYELFIKAMSIVISGNENIKAVIAGQPVADEPELPQKLRELVHQLNLKKNIKFLGFCDDVPLLMERLNIFCLTSSHEGSPNVILEALSAGCPIVASKIGGVPEIIQDGKNGLLFESGDVNACAEAIKKALENPSFAEEMINNGKKMVKNKYSCEKTAQQYEELYRTVSEK